MEHNKKDPKLPRGSSVLDFDDSDFNKSTFTFTIVLELECGDEVIATGTIAEDNTCEFYELIGFVTDDNMDEICAKFQEAFYEQLTLLH